MPKQQDLPGMSDRKLKDLHECAEEYAEKRDERQAIGLEEVALKARLLGLLKKHKLDHYEYEGVTIDRIMEEETVKVKIRKAKAEED